MKYIPIYITNGGIIHQTVIFTINLATKKKKFLFIILDLERFFYLLV
jgi:hypothetical protein